MAKGDDPRPRILVVDDDPAVAQLLEHVLTMEGYEVGLAADGREALGRLPVFHPDLVLLDLDMPHVNGFEVCRQIKQNPATRLLPVLILTGRHGPEDRLRAWDLGADDFLTKPPSPVEVRARCRSLLRVKRLVDELDSAQSVVIALARALEAKSSYTYGHSDRVTAHALRLAARLGLSGEEREVIRLGAILHDIGKINLPDAVLDKPGRLTAEEFDLVKRHPLEGVRILEPLRSLRGVIPLVRWHHERMDGSGYPDGLLGGTIPLAARLLAVADVYDALGSLRSYRPAMARERCFQILREEARAGKLDPYLVECFVQLTAVELAGTQSR